MRKLKLTLIWVFLAVTVLMLTLFKLTQPRIMVLHSYDSDYAWVRDIDTGIHRVLDAKLRYKVSWHYMDTKNHPDADYKRKAGALARQAIKSTNPDLIIAVDDDAQEYAVKEYANDPKVKIVFAGINGSVTPYGYDKAENVTGIYERKPMLDLKRALDEMRHADGTTLGHRLAHLGDRSSSVLLDIKEIDDFDWAPYKLVQSTLATTFDEWKKLVAEMGGKADVLILSNYHNIFVDSKKTALVPAQEVMDWTELNSRIPVVGMGGFMVEDGGMFAVGASGFEQGETVSRMAIAILDKGAVPHDIPTVLPHQFLIYMRNSLMVKRDLKLPPLFEAFARAANNYYD